jgi:uncharacterized protein (TIGR04255 family)
MPKQFDHLSNAPIIEAIIDVRIEPAAEDRWTHEGREFPLLLETHPTTELIIANLLQAQFANEISLSSELQREIIGYRFRNEHDVIQFRVDGFTFSMLPKYSSWDDLFEQAWQAWELYKEARGDASIVRLAVRYINRMQFPIDQPLKTFLTAPPHLPDTLRLPLRRFFTTYDVELNSETHATIIQTVEPATSGTLPFILDIDAYRTGSFTSDDKRIRETFETLHEFKNEIFFESITEEAKKLWR